MGTPTKLLVRFLIVCSGFAAMKFAVAEEMQVYESLANVEVGRIFLSPAERSSLDARRGKAAPVVSSDVAVEKAVAKRSPDAAGYILRSDGPSRVWSNGSFVPSADVSGVTFPGDIEILRIADRERDAEPGARDDGS